MEREFNIIYGGLLMNNQIEAFIGKLQEEGRAINTIKSYKLNMEEFFRWFADSYGNTEFKGLYRANINEYKNYLKNIKRVETDQHNLDGKSINAKLSALVKFNELMQPDNIVISKGDFIKIQENMINPTDVTKKDVEEFRQRVLQSEGCQNIRNYAIVTIMAYGGLRISEVLHLKKIDVNIRDAVDEYQRHYSKEETEYLFYNKDGNPLCRSTINKVFNEFSNKITPHTLRHFFSTNALESGAYSINEVAQQAGHSNIHTTMRYTNPNLDKMKEKAELL